VWRSSLRVRQGGKASPGGPDAACCQFAPRWLLAASGTCIAPPCRCRVCSPFSDIECHSFGRFLYPGPTSVGLSPAICPRRWTCCAYRYFHLAAVVAASSATVGTQSHLMACCRRPHAESSPNVVLNFIVCWLVLHRTCHALDLGKWKKLRVLRHSFIRSKFFSFVQSDSLSCEGSVCHPK